MVLLGVAIAIGLGVGLGVGLHRYQRSRPAHDPVPFSYPKNTTTNTKIWLPKVNQTWDYQLSRVPDLFSPDVEIYGLDLWDTDVSTIQELHADNKSVICYFSAGSYEDWRTDASQFDSQDVGSLLKGWAGENWVNISSPSIRAIMESRIKLASLKNCDAVDPDNIDGYSNKNGLGLTRNDSVSFVNFLAETAHSFNLSISLKNGDDSLVSQLVAVVDFSVQELCHQYNECETFRPFIEHNKPVFNVEYPKSETSNDDNVSETVYNKVCYDQTSTDFSIIFKNISLDSWIQSCQ